MQLYKLDTIPTLSPSSSSLIRVRLISFFPYKPHQHYNTLPWIIRSHLRCLRPVSTKEQRNHEYIDAYLVAIALTFSKNDLVLQPVTLAGVHPRCATVSDLVGHARHSTPHQRAGVVNYPSVAILVLLCTGRVTTTNLHAEGARFEVLSAPGMRNPNSEPDPGKKTARSPTIPLGPTCHRTTKRQTRSTRQRGVGRRLRQVEAHDNLS